MKRQDKKIAAIDLSFDELYRSGPKFISIPSLQRPYVWTKKQIDQLFDDIMQNEPGYFVGTLVNVSGERGTQGEDELIDGQQRLTTLSLMVAALKNIEKANSFFKEEEIGFMWYLLSEFSYNKENKRRLIFSNKKTDEIFEKIVSEEKYSIEELDDGQKNMHVNYLHISGKINELKKDDISKFYKKLISVNFIMITCGDQEIAYNLFESINATGVSLASTDLIKNGIFRSLSNDSDSLMKAEESWVELEDCFANNHQKLKTFLRHYWISEGYYTSHAKLFEDFSIRILKRNDKVETLRYLEKALEVSKIYLSLRRSDVESLDLFKSLSSDEKSEIAEELRYLTALRVEQVYPVLIVLYKSSKKPSTFMRSLTKLVAFQAIYKHVPGSPSSIESKYANFASNDVKQEKYREKQLFNDLAEKVKEDYKKDFVESFSSKTKYSKSSKSLTRFPLNLYMIDQGGPDIIKEPTVEHIIPQSSKMKMRHHIGNLTLLPKKKNSSKKFSDRDFSKKVVAFDKGDIQMNKNIHLYPFDTETESAIDARGTQIAETIFEIFQSALKTGRWNV